MLQAWKEFFHEVDPDIITGYNIIKFDLPYIFDRAKALEIDDFPQFSRIKGQTSEIKKSELIKISNYTLQGCSDISIEGRLDFDMIKIMQREHKMQSYRLDLVAQKFLGQQKEGVQYSEIYDLQHGDELTRQRLAVYCIKDAYLPLKLMEKLNYLYEKSEIARLSGIPLSYLHSTVNDTQLHRLALAKGKLIPSLLSSSEQYSSKLILSQTRHERPREFYRHPIVTLSFDNLELNLLSAQNICVST